MGNEQVVEFHFYRHTKGGKGHYDLLTGKVRTEGDQMILEVELEDDRPYLIVGRKAPWGGFEGSHHGEPDDYEVQARWNSVGDQWLGTWSEADYSYVISFASGGRVDGAE